MSISFENIFRTVDKCARTHTRHFKKSRKHRQSIHILHDSLISGFPDKRIRSFAEALVLTLLFRLSKMYCTTYSPAQIQIRFVYFMKKNVLHGNLWDLFFAPGNPRRGFPTPKQSAGLFWLPSCAFFCQDFADCGRRPKAPPLESAIRYNKLRKLNQAKK